MSNNHSTHIYSFLDFQFIPSQHQLHHQGQTIQLSKKNHDLLIALVQSNGQVLEKDQLINLIWPSQIVTDAALNKQITRLRQTLAEYDEAAMIETIRGVGIRFITEVHSEALVTDRSRQSKKSVWVITSIILAIGLVLWLLQKNLPAETAEWDQISTVNMAIIPAINNDNWLNVGAIDFLSSQLLEYPVIQTIEPEMNWFKQSDAEIFAIELSQTAGIEYVLMLKNQSNQNGYSADLSLRNAQQTIAKKSLQAESITLLLNQIETWTLQQLGIEAELANSQVQAQSATTEFVMENYLRGLAAAQARQYSQAQRLLKTATDEDPKFYPAWFTLADVESELGHFDKALGLIETLSNSTSLDAGLQPKIQAVKAKILVYLNRLDDAQIQLDLSTQAAEVNQDINIIMKNLNTQAILNDYDGEMGEADLLNYKKLLALTKKHNPSPNQIAEVQHNLAVTYLHTGDLENATQMIELAINHFKTSNNAEGLVSSYRVLGEMHAMQAKNGEALLAMEKAMPWVDQVEGARTLANFWMAKARSHYEQGELAAAKECIEALHQMSITYSTLQPKVKAWSIEVELAITFGDYQEARRVADKLVATISENPEAYPSDGSYAVALDIYTDILNGQIVEAKIKKQQYLSAYPQLAEWITDELSRIDAYILAAEGFEQQAIEQLSRVEQSYLDQKRTLTANYIAKEIIEILKKTDATDKSAAIETVINRVKSRSHFVYPVNKFQAQLMQQQGKLIPAISLLSELKVQAKDFWTAQDQLLLENWQQQNSQL